MSVIRLRKELRKKSSKKVAAISRRFFKTGPGQYGEGDIFIGLKIPVIREIVLQYIDLPHLEISKLLKSPIHEERLAALFILVAQYRKAKAPAREKIYKFYLKHKKWINNWDLIDLTAPLVVGDYLSDKSKKPLHQMAKSKNLWERRIAIVATYQFIKKNHFSETLQISQTLLNDSHDLIHKAVGWMLREVGKKEQNAEENFLRKHYKKMPRTMLRYAIERFPEKKRQAYLKGKIQ